jgi:hypothetical protein
MMCLGYSSNWIVYVRIPTMKQYLISLTKAAAHLLDQQILTAKVLYLLEEQTEKSYFYFD